METKITCVIPVLNGVKTVERAIVSAYKAGCSEVLVYDDHSTDESLTLLDHLACQYFCKLIAPPDRSGVLRGVNFARNWLIENARNDLIIPLDCDDELHSIKPLIDAYKPGTWVYGDYVQKSGGIETLYTGLPIGMLHSKNVTHATFLFAKADWERVGGYDPDFAYAEDYGFQCALVNAGIEGVYVNETIHTRHISDYGNDRTAKAGLFWNFYRNLAKMKYPSVLQTFG